jgi:hypothetical protein
LNEVCRSTPRISTVVCLPENFLKRYSLFYSYFTNGMQEMIMLAI